jgi:hypothetical protein
MKYLSLLVVFVIGCLPAQNPTTAHPITDESELLHGTDATGGLGDWFLGNELVAAVIDDPRNQNGISPSGGTLIDFVSRAHGNDQFNGMFQVFLLQQSLPFVYDEIEAQSPIDGVISAITVKGHLFSADPKHLLAPIANLVEIITEYKLYSNDPALYVTTILNNNSPVELTSPFGAPMSDVILWGHRGPQAFAPFPGRGFSHPVLDVSDPVAALGAYSFVAAVGEATPQASYAILSPTNNYAQVTGVNDDQLTAVGQPILTPGILPGQSSIYERRILVGENNSVESVAAQAFHILARETPTIVAGVGTLTGKVTGLAPGRLAQIIAEIPDDIGAPTPYNEIKVHNDMPFRLTLPVGTYQLRVSYGAGEPVIVGPFVVTANTSTIVPDLQAPAMATLHYVIKSDGWAQPARLTLKGVGNADPQLGPMFTGNASRNVSYSVDGTGTLAVEPGTYDIYASRGLEYTLGRQRLTLLAGETQSLEFALTRVVQTSGYLSGDFHVHSAYSFDSSADLEARVLSYAGEGVDVMISTDHDSIIDFAPTIESLGLQAQIASVVGVESTGFVPTPQLPHTIGHNNAWPLQVSSSNPRHGAPSDEFIQPGELYERLRAITVDTAVVQLNHPRSYAVGTVGLGYFTNFKYNPTLPIPDHDDGGTNAFLRHQSPVGGTDNLGFDAMEVLNGTGRDNIMFAQQNRDDWFGLLKNGVIRTGTANSDSHQIALEAAGFPRTYVKTGVDTPKNFAINAFNESILQHRVMGTTGPFIEASIDGKGPGDTVMGHTVQLNIRVQAAPWIAVDEIRVIVNGILQRRLTERDGLASKPVDPYGSTGALRYDNTIAIDITKDSFIVVEAGAALPLAKDLDHDGVIDTWDANNDGTVDDSDAAAGGLPMIPTDPILEALVPGLLPWGFTNPIFVDTDEQGWVPPGFAS